MTNGVVRDCTISDVTYDITLIECGNVLIESNVLRCTKDAVMAFESERTRIVDNDFAYGNRGIQLESSDNSTISGNTFLTHAEFAIVLAYSNNNTIFHNDLTGTDTQIVLDYANDNKIDSCNFSDCSNAIMSSFSSRTVIRGNTFSLTVSTVGVSLYEGNNVSIMNNVFGPSWYGVMGVLSEDLVVRNNTFPNNIKGLYAEGCERSVIERNSFLDDQWGIHVTNSNHNTARENNVTECSYGMQFEFSDSNTILENNCSDNDVIGLSTRESHFNLIADNILSGNKYGIYLLAGDGQSTIVRNNLTASGVSAVFISGANENVFAHNLLRGSGSYGFYVIGSTGNQFYLNVLVENRGSGGIFDPTGIQAYDESSDNRWNSTDGYGNYWGDWTSPDANADGIVDVPYNLVGAGTDLYPLASFMSRPRDLTVTAGEGYADLEWGPPNYTAGSDVQAYRVYRYEAGDLDGIYSVPATSTSLRDEGVSVWHVYSYRVAAVNALGEGPAAGEVEARIPDWTDPTVRITFPDNGHYASSDVVTVEWTGSDAGSGIGHYEVRLDDGGWTNVSTSVSHSFASLSVGEHVVWVRAVDNASNANTTNVTFKVGMGTISGRVMSGRSPVSGANVSLETGIFVLTASDGTFTIEAFAGAHILTVTKEGYETQTWDVDLTAGEQEALGDLEVKKSGIDLMLVAIIIVAIAAAVMVIFAVMRIRRH